MLEFALGEFPVAGLNIWVNEVKNEGILTAERGLSAYMVCHCRLIRSVGQL